MRPTKKKSLLPVSVKRNFFLFSVPFGVAVHPFVNMFEFCPLSHMSAENRMNVVTSCNCFFFSVIRIHVYIIYARYAYICTLHTTCIHICDCAMLTTILRNITTYSILTHVLYRHKIYEYIIGYRLLLVTKYIATNVLQWTEKKIFVAVCVSALCPYVWICVCLTLKENMCGFIYILQLLC